MTVSNSQNQGQGIPLGQMDLNALLAPSPEQSENHKTVKRFAQYAKIASVVVAAVSLIFAAKFFGVFTALLAGSITYVCSEIYRVASNISDPTVINATPELVPRRFTEGAPLARFVWAITRG